MQVSAFCENPLLLADKVDDHGYAGSQYHCKEFVCFDGHQFLYAAAHNAETKHHFDIRYNAQEQFVGEYVHQATEAIKGDVTCKTLIRFVALSPRPIFVEIIIRKYAKSKTNCLCKPGGRSLRYQVINA